MYFALLSIICAPTKRHIFLFNEGKNTKPCTILLKTVLLSISLLTSSLLLAQDFEVIPNVSIGLAGHFPESDRNLDDSAGVVFGGEFPITGRWSMAADYFVINTEVQSDIYDADFDYFRVG